jgi:hypothetical protein
MKKLLPYRGYNLEILYQKPDWQVGIVVETPSLPKSEINFIISSSEENAIMLAKQQVDQLLTDDNS